MKKVFVFFGEHLRGFRLTLGAYIFFCIVNSGFSLALPQVSGRLIDYLVSTGTPSIINIFTILFVGISLTKLVVDFFTERIHLILQTKIGFRVNAYVISHLQSLPISFFAQKDLTSMTKKVNMDSNEIVAFCIGTIQKLIINSLVIVLGIILIWRLSGVLVLMLFIMTGIYLVSYLTMKKKVYAANYTYKEAQAAYYSGLNEQLRDIEFLKLQALVGPFRIRLKKALNQLYTAALHTQVVLFLFGGLDKILNLSATLLVFVVGGNAVIKGTMTIGDFTIVTSYCGIMLSAIRYYFNLGKEFQETLVSYVRVKEILQTPTENNGDKLPQPISRISINNLSFSYGDNPIIQNFSADFHKGMLYVLVGPNGSGKSTLMKILAGLYENEMVGQIFINDIRQANANMYRLRESAFGISEQEPVLVNDTIQFNLSFDDDFHEYDLELLSKLISILGLDGFLKQQPNGLNTVINERNDNISGGEKQKISILRSLLKNPEVLILDEPTSALDQNCRTRFIEYINSTKEKRITIIISHDTDLINSADCIIHLPNGTN